MRQQDRKQLTGDRLGAKGLKQLEDVADIRRRREEEHQGGGIVAMAPLPRNLTQHPPFPFLSSLSLPPSLSFPLSSPLLVTTATGEGQKMKRDEKCADSMLSQITRGKFVLRTGSDLLYQFGHSKSVSKSSMLIYFAQKPTEELAKTANYASRANLIMLLRRKSLR